MDPVRRVVARWTNGLASAEFIIGGDLEASYDGVRYVDIRVKGTDRRFFISMAALKNALGLMVPKPVVAAQEAKSYTYEIKMDPGMKTRFDGLVAMLHYNSGWGHSAYFATWCDGDGADQFHVVKGLDESEALRKAVNDVGGRGGDVEISHEDGTFRTESFKR